MAKTYIRALRVCQHCHEEFMAHTTVTKYCGDDCAKRAYKKRKREEKEANTILPAREHISALLKREKALSISEREFLSVDQAIDLLGSSRMTIYRLTKAGALRSIKIGRRVIISRSDIDKMLGI